MALALKKDGPGLRAKECMAYLFEGFEAFLMQRSDAALSGERYLKIELNRFHAYIFIENATIQ